MGTRKAKKRSDFPPNPAHWQPERNGLAFRRQFDVQTDLLLRPFDIAKHLTDVKLLGRADLERIVAPDDLRVAFGSARHRWSAVTIPMPADGHIVILNYTHATTRQNATLMEELFHIVLRHKPSKIKPCPVTGLMKREFNRTVENEAYWSAAAALVPYAALRQMVDDGHSARQIADHFQVSVALVQFRLKVTKLWRRATSAIP
jgi:IrrE N-terminal-like domain